MTPRTETSAQIILRIVAEGNRLSVKDILTRTQRRRITHPRHELFFVTRECTRFSIPQIGQIYGGFDRGSVLHGLRAATKRMAECPDYTCHVLDLIGDCRLALRPPFTPNQSSNPGHLPSPHEDL